MALALFPVIFRPRGPGMANGKSPFAVSQEGTCGQLFVSAGWVRKPAGLWDISGAISRVTVAITLFKVPLTLLL